ncbi:hypothetical protein ACO0LO_09865 [Undibacterium sp. TJN25]|uniref:hypothetical protein n=1 Tax=Undibacterium sp. TJN25 TaxID=3413056 RepID=UPI003BF13344
MLKRLSGVAGLFPTSILVGISNESIAIFRAQRFFRKFAEPIFVGDYSLDITETHDSEQFFSKLRNVLLASGCAGKPIQIVLGNEQVRLFFVTPPDRPASLKDCRAAAAMRFQALYGEPVDNWRLDADWDACAPFLACAIPEMQLARFNDVISKLDSNLISIQPYFISAWNRWRKNVSNNDWFGVSQNNHFALATLNHRRLMSIRTIHIENLSSDQYWLDVFVRREALRLNVSQPTKLLICGSPIDSEFTYTQEGTVHVNHVRLPRESKQRLSDARQFIINTSGRK